MAIDLEVGVIEPTSIIVRNPILELRIEGGKRRTLDCTILIEEDRPYITFDRLMIDGIEHRAMVMRDDILRGEIQGRLSVIVSVDTTQAVLTEHDPLPACKTCSLVAAA